MDEQKPQNEAGSEPDEPAPDTKYHITVHGPVSGLTIGDENRVSQTFGGAAGSPALDSPAYAAARERYLEALRERYSIIQTHAYAALAQDERVGQPRQLPLLGPEGVYVPLTFNLDTKAEFRAASHAPAEGGPLLVVGGGAGKAGLTGVLQQPGHLAIIGAAGSGKTTVLHLLVTALTLPPEQDPLLPEDLSAVLPRPRPLPVLLPLRLFEHACGQQRYQRSAADLLRFVDDWFGGWCASANLPPGFLAAHLCAGPAWLLLDALDEVPDPDHRQTMRNLIEDLARDLPHTRLLVTARVAAYKDTQLNDHFTPVWVRDLSDSRRAALVRAIYRGLAYPDHTDRAEELIARFADTPDLAELGRTPVLVWTAAVIHAVRGQLPEGRAALYNAYVNILLDHSFKRSQYDTAALTDLVSGGKWPKGDRHRYLSYAAFQVHRRLEEQPEQRGQRRPVIDETTLACDILGSYFLQENPTLKKRQADELGHEFVSLMVAHSGLLHETPEGYTLGDHLTMQEFLAGCYLSKEYQYDDPAGYAAFLQDNVGQSWWREVFLLAVGYLADDDSNTKAAQRLLREIAGQGHTPAEQLTAHSLAGRGLLQLRQRRQRPSWVNPEAAHLAGQLYRQLYAEPAAASVAVRQEAGLTLGRLYHQNDQPDPRFAHPLGLPDFSQMGSGWFWMGSAEAEVAQLEQETGKDSFKRELPRHRVYLDGFELARYPTTNAMFARFIEAGGYGDERWWVEAMADGSWKEGVFKDYFSDERIQPVYWNDPRFNNPAQPVVGVTWYEAAAYCRWLTATLNDGYTYRLPTEAEWEGAARSQPPTNSPQGGESRQTSPPGGD